MAAHPPDSRRLHELAARVADGAPVDWDAESTAGGPDEAAIRNVRAFAEAMAVSAPSRSVITQPLRTRAPWWVRPLVWLAVARNLMGVIGVVYTPNVLVGRVALLWIFAAFVVVFTFVGLLLLYGANRERRATYLGAFYVVAASAFSFSPMTNLSAAWPDMASFVRPLQHTRTDAFMPAFLWLFIAAFPAVAEFVRPQRIAASATPVALAAGAILAIGHLAFEYGAGGAQGAWLRGFDVFPHGGFSLYWTAVFLLGLGAIIVALWKTSISRDEERRRVAWFIGGIVVGMAPLVAMVFAVNLIPHVRAWANAGGIMRSGVVVYPFLLSIPVTTAYAVLVKRVLDLRLAVRKALQYLLTRYALLALSIAPLVVLGLYLYREREQSLAEIVTGATALNLIGLAALGVVLSRLRTRVMDGVDLVFFREHHAPGPLIERLIAGCRMVRSDQDVADTLRETIEFGFHPQSVAVLVRAHDGVRYAPVAGTSRPLPVDSALALLLRQSPDPLVMDLEAEASLARMLPPHEQDWILDGAVCLLAPLTGADGELLGMISVGPRRSELAYSKTDRDTLRALAASAASVLERAQGVYDRGVDRQTADSDAPARECLGCGMVAESDDTRSCRCSVPLRDALLPRMLLGKFRIERRLGAGGMGVVYEALDVALDRSVAIKTLPHLLPEAAQRARREARAMAAVQHPNLALLYGMDSWRGTPLLVVEFLAGGTLNHRLKRGRLTPEEVITLGAALAAGLDHMHRSGMLHRDIKPSNIGFGADGSPKLLDFGLARLTGPVRRGVGNVHASGQPMIGAQAVDRDGSLTGSHRLAGTPLYMAPEALRGEPPAPSFDLWSLALVLFEALAGVHPFKAESIDEITRRIASTSIPDLASIRPELPPAIAGFFRAALAHNVRQRPATAQKMREQLLAMAPSLESSIPAPGGQ